MQVASTKKLHTVPFRVKFTMEQIHGRIKRSREPPKHSLLLLFLELFQAAALTQIKITVVFHQQQHSRLFSSVLSSDGGQRTMQESVPFRSCIWLVVTFEMKTVPQKGSCLASVSAQLMIKHRIYKKRQLVYGGERKAKAD